MRPRACIRPSCTLALLYSFPPVPKPILPSPLPPVRYVLLFIVSLYILCWVAFSPLYMLLSESCDLDSADFRSAFYYSLITMCVGRDLAHARSVSIYISISISFHIAEPQPFFMPRSRFYEFQVNDWLRHTGHDVQ